MMEEKYNFKFIILIRDEIYDIDKLESYNNIFKG